MLGMVVAVLLQAVAGEPEPAPGAPDAVATAQVQETAAIDAAAEGAPERVICRREPTLGSRLGVRRCVSERAERETAERTQQNLSRLQNRSGTTTPGQ